MPSANPVYLITGAASGIGKAIARRLIDDGAAVVIADLDASGGKRVVDECSRFGELLFVQTDVTSERSVAACVKQALRKLGRLDGLVNDAGIADPYNAPIDALELADWNRMLATDLTGMFLMVKHCLPALRKQPCAAIVNIASTRAGQSEPNSEAYAASKGGVVALTHALAISLGPKLRVNCISPGWIDTSAWQPPRRKPGKPQKLRKRDHEQHPVGRVGQPEDVASLASWLLGPEAAFVTGQNFVLDGGMTRKMIYAE
jgi:NAD(P)-dependent dehydrogenase (short-subunit alcohol dehydrogenase family)